MKKLNGTVIVTYRCNAKCTMCNRYKVPSKPEDEISIEITEYLNKINSIIIFTFSSYNIIRKSILITNNIHCNH